MPSQFICFSYPSIFNSFRELVLNFSFSETLHDHLRFLAENFPSEQLDCSFFFYKIVYFPLFQTHYRTFMQTRTTRELNYDAQETFDQNIFILIYNKQKVAKGLLLSAVFFATTTTFFLKLHQLVVSMFTFLLRNHWCSTRKLKCSGTKSSS